MTKLKRVFSSPAWFVVPALAVAGAVWMAVQAHEPLVFDPSMFPAPQAAQAAELRTIDAEAIEAEHSEPVDLEMADPDEALAAAAGARLADGTYTGYAPCGVGNPDGWKAYYIGVTIQVQDGKVVAITDVFGTSVGDGGMLDWDAAENQSYLDWAAQGKGGQAGVLAQINGLLAAGSTVGGIDTVSGATYSSVAIYNAYVAALSKAGSASGVPVPEATEAQQMDVPSTAAAQQAEPPRAVAAPVEAGDVAGASLADGTWVGYAPCGVGNEDEWKPYYVAVTVSVAGGKVVGIDSVTGTSSGDAGQAPLNWDAAENQAYLDWAGDGRTRGGVFYQGVLQQMRSAIAAGANPGSIDTVSGATYSSESIFNAYYAALRKAAAAAGAQAPEPAPEPTPAGNAAGGQASGGTGAQQPGASGTSGNAGGTATGANQGSGDETGTGDNAGAGDDVADDGNTVRISGDFPDGTYSGYAFCKDLDAPSAYAPYYLFVTVEAKDGKIVSITDIYGDDQGQVDPLYVYDRSENGSYLNRAINGYGVRTKGLKERIQAKLDAGEDVPTIDTISSATWSSKSIYEAFAAAVASANQRAQDLAAQQAADAAASSSADAAANAVADGPADVADVAGNQQAAETGSAGAGERAGAAGQPGAAEQVGSAGEATGGAAGEAADQASQAHSSGQSSQANASSAPTA